MTSTQSIYAETPQPPYYAVIFTALSSEDQAGHDAMSAAMVELAKKSPGYLGIEAVGVKTNITISYWRDTEAILTWKKQVDHLAAQRLGQTRWYDSYRVRIARVEREYGWER
jgi:heme-degrading monooxygenase HmoA